MSNEYENLSGEAGQEKTPEEIVAEISRGMEYEKDLLEQTAPSMPEEQKEEQAEAKTSTDVLDHLAENMERVARLQKKKNLIEETEVNEKYDGIQEDIQTRDKIKKLSLETPKKEDVERSYDLVERDRLLAKKAGKPFFPVFGDYFPPMPQTVTGIMAKTGDGKSTFVSNLAVLSCEAKLKALVVSNEETVEIQMIRTAATSLGIPFRGISKFTDDEMKLLREEALRMRFYLNFMDDNSAGKPGLFTTPEGIDAFFNRIEGSLKDIRHDIILLDYYQGVVCSTKKPSLKEHEAQAMFVRRVEKFRNEVGIPIFLMGQLWDKKGSFQERIKGSRSISQRLTGALELISNKEDFTSKLIVRKSRFEGHLCGKELNLELVAGRFHLIEGDDCGF